MGTYFAVKTSNKKNVSLLLCQWQIYITWEISQQNVNTNKMWTQILLSSSRFHY